LRAQLQSIRHFTGNRPEKIVSRPTVWGTSRLPKLRVVQLLNRLVSIRVEKVVDSFARSQPFSVSVEK
jgi:hypothetical protein